MTVPLDAEGVPYGDEARRSLVDAVQECDLIPAASQRSAASCRCLPGLPVGLFGATTTRIAIRMMSPSFRCAVDFFAFYWT